MHGAIPSRMLKKVLFLFSLYSLSAQAYELNCTATRFVSIKAEWQPGASLTEVVAEYDYQQKNYAYAPLIPFADGNYVRKFKGLDRYELEQQGRYYSWVLLPPFAPISEDFFQGYFYSGTGFKPIELECSIR